MKLCRRYFVSGRVQGVFFRASTRNQAERLGLVGWVRNLHDGRVEVLAQGEDAQLELLEKWLQTGPDHAKVTNIEVITEAAGDSLDGFDILTTR